MEESRNININQNPESACLLLDHPERVELYLYRDEEADSVLGEGLEWAVEKEASKFGQINPSDGQPAERERQR